MSILKGIKPIHEGCVIFKHRDEIRNYVEAPLLKTAEMFYDLNIETTSSTCHEENSTAVMFVNLDTLSEQNKQIALMLAESNPEHFKISDVDLYIQNKTFLISAEISKFNGISELSKFFEKVAAQFKLQDCEFGKLSFDKIIRSFGQNTAFSFTPIDEWLKEKPNRFILKDPNGKDLRYTTAFKNEQEAVEQVKSAGVVYDENEKQFYWSEELYKKHLAFLGSQKNKNISQKTEIEPSLT